jgi:hypothetical protein
LIYDRCPELKALKEMHAQKEQIEPPQDLTAKLAIGWDLIGPRMCPLPSKEGNSSAQPEYRLTQRCSSSLCP